MEAINVNKLMPMIESVLNLKNENDQLVYYMLEEPSVKETLSKLIVRTDKMWYGYLDDSDFNLTRKSHWIELKTILDVYAFVEHAIPKLKKDDFLSINLLDNSYCLTNDNEKNRKRVLLVYSIIPNMAPYNYEIFAKFDSNRNLIGFLNGTYDISIKEFRNAKKEDMILSPLHIEYFPFLPDKENMIEITNLIEFDFPDPEIRSNYISLFFNLLRGIERDTAYVFPLGKFGLTMIETYLLFFTHLFQYEIEYIGNWNHPDELIPITDTGKPKKFICTVDLNNMGLWSFAIHHPFTHIKYFTRNPPKNIIKFDYLASVKRNTEKGGTEKGIDYDNLKESFVSYILAHVVC
jgi:hypothetical protein